MSTQALSLSELLRLNSLSSSGSCVALQCSRSSVWSKRRREKLLELQARLGFVQLRTPGQADLCKTAACCFCDSFSSPCSDKSPDAHSESRWVSSFKDASQEAKNVLTGRRSKLALPRRLSTDLHGLEDVAKFWAACGKPRRIKPADAATDATPPPSSAGEDGLVLSLNRTCSPLSDCVEGCREGNLVSIAQRLDFGSEADILEDHGNPDRGLYPCESRDDSKLHFVRGRKQGRTVYQKAEEVLPGNQERKMTFYSPRKEQTRTPHQKSFENCTPEKNRFGQDDQGVDLSFGGDYVQYNQDEPFLLTPEEPTRDAVSFLRDSTSRTDTEIEKPLTKCNKAVQAALESPKFRVTKRRLEKRFVDIMNQRERELYLSKRNKLELRSAEPSENGRRKRMRVLRFWRGETVEYALHDRLRFPTLSAAVVAPASPRDMLPCTRRRYTSEAPKSGFRAFCKSRIVTPERAAFYNDIRPRSAFTSR
jgi:hypothetical protein